MIRQCVVEYAIFDHKKLIGHVNNAFQFYFDPADWGNISNDAKDLITKMLTLDPTKRIVAEDALAHPWIEQLAKIENGTIQAPLLLNALGNMRKFQASQKLAQAAFLYIGSKVSCWM